MSGGTYSLISTPNVRFLSSFFMSILFTLRVFARNLLRGSGPWNIFSYFRFDVWPVIWTTHHVLDYGDFKFANTFSNFFLKIKFIRQTDIWNILQKPTINSPLTRICFYKTHYTLYGIFTQHDLYLENTIWQTDENFAQLFKYTYFTCFLIFNGIFSMLND